ncbi:hypothetical protein RFI_30109, partial [Reticulomyxa filosa]
KKKKKKKKTMSGSDLDGDLFWITWDKRLLQHFPKVNEQPLLFPDPVPKEVPTVTIDHLQQFFVNYLQFDNLGVCMCINNHLRFIYLYKYIYVYNKKTESLKKELLFFYALLCKCIRMCATGHAHLAQADQQSDMAKHSSCLRLAALHSLAVDYRKSGVPVDLRQCAQRSKELLPRAYPDFMQRRDKDTYTSDRVLGKIYRLYRDFGKNNLFGNNSVKIFLNKPPKERPPLKQLMNKANIPLPLQSFFSEWSRQRKEDKNFVERIVKPVSQLIRSYQREMESIQNRFSVQNEIQLFMNLVDKKKNKTKEKMHFQTNSLKWKYRRIFFEDFGGSGLADNEFRHKFTPKNFNITEEMKKKASCWYWVSLYTLRKDTEIALGFPFVVYDILCAK